MSKNIKNKKRNKNIDNLLLDGIVVFMDPAASDQPTVIHPPAKRPAGTLTSYDTDNEYQSSETEFAKRQNTSYNCRCKCKY